MASLRTNPLPSPSEEYDSENEQTMRRTVEFALQNIENDVLLAKTQEFALQNIENDVLLAKTQADKDGSLAMRRFQFLLMGAS